MSLGVARGLRPRRPVAAQYTRGLRPRRPVAAQYTRSLERTPGAGGRGEAGRPRPVGTEPLSDCTSKHVCMCRRFSRPFPVRRKTGWRLRGSRDNHNVRVSERCVLTAKPDGTGTGEHWLTSLRRTAVRRGGPAPRIVGYEKQTDASHATIGSDLAGSAGTHMAEAVCRHSYGLVDSAAGQPELAPGTDPSSQPSNGPTTSPESERASIRREGW